MACSPGDSFSKSLPLSTHSKVNQYIPFTCNPSTFQTATSTSILGFRSIDTVCWHSKSGDLDSHSLMTLQSLSPAYFSKLPELNPTDFQNQTLWGLIFLVQNPRVSHSGCLSLSPHPSVHYFLSLMGWVGGSF